MTNNRNFTKEQLIEKLQHRISVTANYPDVEEAQLDAAIFKIALASLGAKPIYQYQSGIYNDDNGETDWYWDDCDAGFYKQYAADRRRIVYTATPAPVVPPAIEPDYEVIKSILPTANPDEYACCIAADMWNACRAAMLQGAEPVSQTYELPELIEGMEVSIDVSTCDADAGNRYFGTVTEISELYTAKNGYILLVQDAKPNFDVNGNSPVSLGGWISCSERMPEDEQEVIVHNKLGYRYVSYFDEHSGLFFDMRGGNQMNCIEHILVTHWMPLPAAPQQ